MLAAYLAGQAWRAMQHCMWADRQQMLVSFEDTLAALTAYLDERYGVDGWWPRLESGFFAGELHV